MKREAAFLKITIFWFFFSPPNQEGGSICICFSILFSYFFFVMRSSPSFTMIETTGKLTHFAKSNLVQEIRAL